MFLHFSGSIDHIIYNASFSHTVFHWGKIKQKVLPFHIDLIAPSHDDINYISTYTNITYSRAGFKFKFSRRFSPYFINWFCPTTILVLISWISFFIPPEIVPGRMALLVTIFLMMVNISNSANEKAPEAQGLTALDVWIWGCILFVAAALFEYAVLLKLKFPDISKIQVSNEHAKTKLNTRYDCGKIDRRALFIFVAVFALFNICYWMYYV